MTLYEPAPHWKRFFAATVDLVSILIVTNIAVLPLTAMVGLKELGPDPARAIQEGQIPLATLGTLLVLALIATFLMHLYFVWFEVEKGATPGKMLVGLEVISQDGKNLTKRQALTRELARWYLDIPFFLLAVIPMIATNKRTRFGDMLAKTQVITKVGPRKVVHASTSTRSQGS